MVKYNQEDMKKVATKVVEGWEMKALINFAEDTLIEKYEGDKKAFEEDAK